MTSRTTIYQRGIPWDISVYDITKIALNIKIKFDKFDGLNTSNKGKNRFNHNV